MPRKKATPKAKTPRELTREPVGQAAKMTPGAIQELADMHLRACSIVDMANHFKISKSTVHYHLKRIKTAWRENLSEGLPTELAKLAQLEKVAWIEWEASRRTETTVKQEFEEPEATGKAAKRKTAKKLADAGAEMRLAKKSVTRVKRTGSTAYLDVVRWCIEYRCKLLGYLQPQEDEKAQQKTMIIVEVETKEQARKAIAFEDFQDRLHSEN